MTEVRGLCRLWVMCDAPTSSKNKNKNKSLAVCFLELIPHLEWFGALSFSVSRLSGSVLKIDMLTEEMGMRYFEKEGAGPGQKSVKIPGK